MALEIIATAGASDANSLVTTNEMTAYCATRLNASAWTDVAAKWPALTEATRDVSLMLFVGTRVTLTQALSWPRDWARNPDQPEVEFIGNIELMYYPRTVIPQRIKDATCELGLQYLNTGAADLSVIDANVGVIEKTADVLTTRWESGTAAPKGIYRFPRILTMLAPLLALSGTGNRLFRV